ncbi:unnamed protein product [Paramecium sonneborni]|uniref:Transmembrane protein n=1 Tax=Paramecium sonneborni TaxID=65129 RepID=A0A8S1RR52_9CILI|nr:unnamed protein product [Paramecium sonneborni]
MIKINCLQRILQVSQEKIKNLKFYFHNHRVYAHITNQESLIYCLMICINLLEFLMLISNKHNNYFIFMDCHIQKLHNLNYNEKCSKNKQREYKGVILNQNQQVLSYISMINIILFIQLSIQIINTFYQCY